jgi:hypothetical protein
MTDVKAPEGLLRVMLAYPGPFVILLLRVSIVVLTWTLLTPQRGGGVGDGIM